MSGRERGGHSVQDALAGAITAITAAGCQTPRLDAEVLLADVLGVDRSRLIIDRDLLVRGPAVRAFQDAVRRRAVLREPVAYITGTRGFRRLELRADGRALIPRPETELLVEAALTLAVGSPVIDVCTGSGAVALALKDERPDLLVSASDISEQALALARENGTRLGLEVTWIRADLLEGVGREHVAVLANPPYVQDSARAELAPEITRHEPPGALFAGADGMDVIERLLEQIGARAHIAFAAIEIGAGQARRACALAAAAGFSSVRVLDDLAGIPRVIVAERREG